jgi:hypothetical protein
MLNPSFALAELSTTDCGEIRDGVALRLAAAACGEIRDGVALRLAAAALLGGWRWRWPRAWRERRGRRPQHDPGSNDRGSSGVHPVALLTPPKRYQWLTSAKSV